jgi:hypothetical protein
MGGGGQFVLGGDGNYMLNPTFLPAVPVGMGEDYDYEAAALESQNTLQTQLNEINQFDSKWKGEKFKLQETETLHPSDPNWNPGRRVGPYSLTQDMEQDRLNSMPDFHPRFNAEKNENYNQYYSDLVDKNYADRRTSDASIAKSNNFTGNLLKSLADPFINAPSRLINYGANELFGDGTKTVDWRSPMFRPNSMDASGSLQDYNPDLANIIPGHENRNAFANGLINVAGDPYSYFGGAGLYKQAPKMVQNFLKKAPGQVFNSTKKSITNTFKKNIKGIKDGSKQITKGNVESTYFNPMKARLHNTATRGAGLGNLMYYSSKTAALPGAALAVGEFGNDALFSKDGVTMDDALNTGFDVMDTRLPFSSSIRDMYKGLVRGHQDGDMLSRNAIPYYSSSLIQNKTINPYIKGYRTAVSYLGDPFAPESDTRLNDFGLRKGEDLEYPSLQPTQNTPINGQ